jgi:hypothetical protein
MRMLAPSPTLKHQAGGYTGYGSDVRDRARLLLNTTRLLRSDHPNAATVTLDLVGVMQTGIIP